MTAPPLAPEALILFDGVCNLCNGTVLWVLARDRRAYFRFASLQSQAAHTALAGVGAPATLPDSILLIEKGCVYVRSDAALRIARGLGWPWSWLFVARIVPRVLRDAVYAWVARNRYRWFGKRESCLVPTPELRARFVDADEVAPTVTGAARSTLPGATAP